MSERMDMEIVVLESILANAKDEHQLKAGLIQAVRLLKELAPYAEQLARAARIAIDAWYGRPPKAKQEAIEGLQLALIPIGRAEDQMNTTPLHVLQAHAAERMNRGIDGFMVDGVKWQRVPDENPARRFCCCIPGICAVEPDTHCRINGAYNPPVGDVLAVGEAREETK